MKRSLELKLCVIDNLVETFRRGIKRSDDSLSIISSRCGTTETVFPAVGTEWATDCGLDIVHFVKI